MTFPLEKVHNWAVCPWPDACLYLLSSPVNHYLSGNFSLLPILCPLGIRMLKDLGELGANYLYIFYSSFFGLSHGIILGTSKDF